MAVAHIWCQIQTDDFDVGSHYQALQHVECGAVVLFSGTVRQQFCQYSNEPLQALLLEHYPAMTEQALQQMARHVAAQFDVHALRVVHRVGQLRCGEQIVLVGVASAHRAAAFAAAEMLMDLLKNQLPIWKKAQFMSHSHWVEAKVSDHQAMLRWQGSA